MHHPDRPGGSKERFQELKEAYDLLANPDTRYVYDRFGREAAERSARSDDPAQEGPSPVSQLLAPLFATVNVFGRELTLPLIYIIPLYYIASFILVHALSRMLDEDTAVADDTGSLTAAVSVLKSWPFELYAHLFFLFGLVALVFWKALRKQLDMSTSTLLQFFLIFVIVGQGVIIFVLFQFLPFALVSVAAYFTTYLLVSMLIAAWPQLSTPHRRTEKEYYDVGAAIALACTALGVLGYHPAPLLSSRSLSVVSHFVIGSSLLMNTALLGMLFYTVHVYFARDRTKSSFLFALIERLGEKRALRTPLRLFLFFLSEFKLVILLWFLLRSLLSLIFSMHMISLVFVVSILHTLATGGKAALPINAGQSDEPKRKLLHRFEGAPIIIFIILVVYAFFLPTFVASFLSSPVGRFVLALNADFQTAALLVEFLAAIRHRSLVLYVVKMERSGGIVDEASAEEEEETEQQEKGAAEAGPSSADSVKKGEINMEAGQSQPPPPAPKSKKRKRREKQLKRKSEKKKSEEEAALYKAMDEFPYAQLPEFLQAQQRNFFLGGMIYLLTRVCFDALTYHDAQYFQEPTGVFQALSLTLLVMHPSRWMILTYLPEAIKRQTFEFTSGKRLF